MAEPIPTKMGADILKTRSPEETKAAYDQAFLQLKDALGIDSKKPYDQGGITLGGESDNISGEIEFEYLNGEDKERLGIIVTDKNNFLLQKFVLDQEGVVNTSLPKQSVVIGGEEVKLKSLEIGKPWFGRGGIQVEFEDNQVVARKLAGIELANWVTKCVAEDKLGPEPEVVIRDAKEKEEPEDFEHEE